MSAHETRKTVATVALAAILVAAPVLPGNARKAGHFRHAITFLEHPLTWVASRLGVNVPQPADDSTSQPPTPIPTDGTNGIGSLDPNGSPK